MTTRRHWWDEPALVARSASAGRLTGMAHKGTADERRAALRKGLKDAQHPKRRPAWLSRMRGWFQ